MMQTLISILSPIGLFIAAPRVTHHFKAKGPAAPVLLASACILFCISWYLPSPLIFGQQTSASAHFIGGGVFTGLLWIYLKIRFVLQRNLFVEALSLYALVCTLGVTNELLELIAVKAGLIDLSLTDTSIDLLVNTCGATLVFLVYALTGRRNRRSGTIHRS